MHKRLSLTRFSNLLLELEVVFLNDQDTEVYLDAHMLLCKMNLSPPERSHCVKVCIKLNSLTSLASGGKRIF